MLITCNDLVFLMKIGNHRTFYVTDFHQETHVLTACYYHVTYEFQSESKFYILPECQGTPCSEQAPYFKFM